MSNCFVGLNSNCKHQWARINSKKRFLEKKKKHFKKFIFKFKYNHLSNNRKVSKAVEKREIYLIFVHTRRSFRFEANPSKFINGYKIQIIVNTRRPGNQFNIFTSLLTLTFPSLSYCLLFRFLFRQLTSRKKQGGELRVFQAKTFGVKNSEVRTRLDISNRWKIITYDHMCGNEKVLRGCVCTNIVVHGWYKKNRESHRTTISFFFFFHHLLLLLLVFIKGMPEVRSRGSKVQKNCAFIREDDARSIFILKNHFLSINSVPCPKYIFHAYQTLASFFSTPPPPFNLKCLR